MTPIEFIRDKHPELKDTPIDEIRLNGYDIVQLMESYAQTKIVFTPVWNSYPQPDVCGVSPFIPSYPTPQSACGCRPYSEFLECGCDDVYTYVSPKQVEVTTDPKFESKPESNEPA